jgi:hypothetical protein
MSRRWGGVEVMSRSSKRIVPAEGAVKPAIIRRRVVLPQPEGPRRKKREPGGMAREREETAGAEVPGKDLERLWRVMASMGGV